MNTFSHVDILKKLANLLVSVILEGNPSDEQQWKPSLKAYQATFKHPPQPASADRGLYSEPNEQFAQVFGVQRVSLPKRGYRSKPRENGNTALGT